MAVNKYLQLFSSACAADDSLAVIWRKGGGASVRLLADRSLAFMVLAPDDGVEDEHDGAGDEEGVGDVEVGPGVEDLELDFGPDEENPVADTVAKLGDEA